MELGSIASTIVCSDADLDRAIPRIANAAFRKAGQVCTSVQRLYVESPCLENVLGMLTEAAKGMPAGDPRASETRVGPMITEEEAIRAESWIRDASRNQARLIHGGSRNRSVLTPTIITNVNSGMKVLDEEIFAPCVVVLPFDELAAAVQHANNTPYGLAAGVFTGSVERAMTAARTLRFGAIHINETSSCRADAMPFGGVKDSGFGHEGPRYAIREITEERLVTFN
jgi:succinate-semialdehyde dehydrogenase/glutarate-semialdehyde dehydrogenase